MAGESWIGKKLGGRYEILEKLGAGGMATVYKANDPNLDRIVAIKVIHHHLSDRPDFIRRFQDEASVVAQLRHPNIVQVFDFNNDGEIFYIVFEFVPGVTLQDHLTRINSNGRKLSAQEVTKYIAQIGSALDYAHGRGLVHRDVKPANIMLNVQGDAILTDFGIAKIAGNTTHTATGAVVGTARYMSPEQIKGETIDGRTDIYSLGIVLYEMISGSPPYDAESTMTILMMHVNDPIPPLDEFNIPDALKATLRTSMAKMPHQRFRTAAEMVSALTTPPVINRPPQRETMIDTDDTGVGLANDPGVTNVDVPSATEIRRQRSRQTNLDVPQPAENRPRPVGAVHAPTGRNSGAQQSSRGGGIWLWAGGVGLLLALGAVGLFASGILGGGNGGQNPTPEATEVIIADVTDTPEPTETASEPLPTATEPPPTDTPEPTATATELPTDTPVPPTATPEPTATATQLHPPRPRCHRPIRRCRLPPRHSPRHRPPPLCRRRPNRR